MNQIEKKKLSLYIHIPFCASKCYYCDFLSGPAPKAEMKEYVTALLVDIRSWATLCKNYQIETIFIGGGTPSLIDSKYIIDILKEVRGSYHLSDQCEITIEINPGTVTKDKFLDYKVAGINRLSLGLQSTNNEELKNIGRIHTYEQFLENYHLAREIGFKNINIDLMSALPGQRVEDFTKTLERIVALEPEHISAYSLIIEEGTLFYEWYGEGAKTDEQKGRKALPTEDEDRIIYEKTKQILSKHGYERYEISNYAKPGYECKHNCVYWQRGDYLGFGIGSASLLNNLRFHNLQDRKAYTTILSGISQEEELVKNNSFLINNCLREDGKYLLQEDVECLSIQSQMEEFMFLGLRLMKGVKKSIFYNNFKKSIHDVYGEKIENLKREHLLVEEEDSIMLTEKGIDLSNVVYAEFLFDEE